MSYENLMRPIRIQNMTLRNRVMMAPMGTNLANPDGSISEEHKNYYQLRAKGGTGLIVVENACVAFPLGSNGTTQLRLDHDSFIPHMYELTEKVHAWGCKISIQVNHAGSAAIPSRIGQQPVSAGDIPCKTGGVIPRALSTEEVYALVGKYADACKRAQMAGFDAVEIHAGHSYLVSQFISPTTNNRTDEFGGSAENRARFLKCILQETRKRLGRNFPIAIRISADELVPGGNTLEDTLGWLPYVDEYVDLYDVSAGLNDSIEKMIDKADLPDGWKRYLSKAVKEKTGNDPLEMFEKAMENIMPNLECKTRRVGGANYQVPLEVSPARRETLGLRWLTAYSRSRGEKTMAQRLAAEIMDAANNTGNAVKKREDTHKMAEANKAFAHFRY